MRWFGDANDLRQLLQVQKLLVREKDILLHEKDILLHEKDIRLQETAIAALIIVMIVIFSAKKLVDEKQALIEEKERSITTLESQLAKNRAQFQAEWNLRPVLEEHLDTWFLRQRKDVPKGGQAKFDVYRSAKKDNRHFENHLVSAMKRNGIVNQNRAMVNNELENIYASLSKRHHLADPPADVTGFVVNNNKYFAAAVSAFLMSFGLEHTVVYTGEDFEGTRVRYKWPAM